MLCKKYTYTSEEVIFTTLSSISCFGNCDEEVERYVAKNPEAETLVKRTESLALLVGTFVDKLIQKKENADEIDQQLKGLVEDTDFFKKGLLYSKECLKVNNYDAEEQEIIEHRSLVEKLLTERFQKFQIPARWLTLSVCLKLLAKKLSTFEVSFKDCVEIGRHSQMSENMVRVALKFLHKYIGIIMYFPNHEHLKNIVICDPQIVFLSVSELIFNVYDQKKGQITEANYDRFVQTGCFSPDDIRSVNKNVYYENKQLLSIETVIYLLLHLNIAAEVPSLACFQAKDYSDQSEEPKTSNSQNLRKEYFLPAVLQTAEAALLEMDSKGENDELLPEPICIRFITGFLPLGFVCALSANLIAESKLQFIPFEEGNQRIAYKNKMRFRFDGEVDVIMISGPKYCEFRVHRCSGNTEFWATNRCPLIKNTIWEAANRVFRSMQNGIPLYQQSKSFEFAFRCPKHSSTEIGHEPLAMFDSVTQSGSTPASIKCTQCHIKSPLTPEMSIWFGEVRIRF